MSYSDHGRGESYSPSDMSPDIEMDYDDQEQEEEDTGKDIQFPMNNEQVRKLCRDADLPNTHASVVFIFEYAEALGLAKYDKYITLTQLRKAARHHRKIIAQGKIRRH